MRVRTVAPLFVLAGLMVFWLSVRMWFGTAPTVWAVSCVIGAWSPLAAAAMFLYVRHIGPHHDSVAVAWVVRALGMHFVLTWMLGFSDWLRGPPWLPPEWNMDLGAPIALISFVPTFAIGVLTESWVLGIARRLTAPIVRPGMPSERSPFVSAFRGVALVAIDPPTASVPIAPYVIGLGGMIAIHGVPSPGHGALALLALALAGATARNHRALIPSVVAIVLAASEIALQNSGGGISRNVSTAVAWPWLCVVGVAVYLAAMEATVRMRSRGSSGNSAGIHARAPAAR